MTKLERAYQRYNQAKLTAVNQRLRADDLRRESTASSGFPDAGEMLKRFADEADEAADLADLETEMFADLARSYEALEEETI